MVKENWIIDINEKILGRNDTILNYNMISSSLSSYYYYDTIENQISSIIRGIAKNHAFIDGNKRTAGLTLKYLSNKFNLKIKSDIECANILIDIASNKYSVEDISKMIFNK